jgi:hypothetical protein
VISNALVPRAVIATKRVCATATRCELWVERLSPCLVRSPGRSQVVTGEAIRVMNTSTRACYMSPSRAGILEAQARLTLSSEG